MDKIVSFLKSHYRINRDDPVDDIILDDDIPLQIKEAISGKGTIYTVEAMRWADELHLNARVSWSVLHKISTQADVIRIVYQRNIFPTSPADVQKACEIVSQKEMECVLWHLVRYLKRLKCGGLHKVLMTFVGSIPLVEILKFIPIRRHQRFVDAIPTPLNGDDAVIGAIISRDAEFVSKWCKSMKLIMEYPFSREDADFRAIVMIAMIRQGQNGKRCKRYIAKNITRFPVDVIQTVFGIDTV